MLLTIINNYIHIIAAITWIGGMLYNIFILFPAMNAIIPQERGKLMGAILKRFMLTVWLSIFALLITGLHRVNFDMILNFSSNYGTFLTIKLIIVLLMILIGINVSFIIYPKMKDLTPKLDETPSPDFIKQQKNLRIHAKANMVLGVLVVLCVVLMRTL